MASRKAARREEREALGRGEMPESLANWKVRGRAAGYLYKGQTLRGSLWEPEGKLEDLAAAAATRK
jgi:hypothetical protein